MKALKCDDIGAIDAGVLCENGNRNAQLIHIKQFERVAQTFLGKHNDLTVIDCGAGLSNEECGAAVALAYIT